ncbi:MAG: glycosyltransferase, partial [Nitrospirota bacterium]
MTNKKAIQNNYGQNNRPTVLIVLPVYNEEKALRRGVERLTSFLRDHNKYDWKIVIADKNTHDNTGNIGRE